MIELRDRESEREGEKRQRTCGETPRGEGERGKVERKARVAREWRGSGRGWRCETFFSFAGEGVDHGSWSLFLTGGDGIYSQ